MKKEARKKVFERLINRREGRKLSRAEYEEMKERRVLLEKNPLEFYSSPHLESFKWGSFHRWARPSLVLSILISSASEDVIGRGRIG